MMKTSLHMVRGVGVALVLAGLTTGCPARRTTPTGPASGVLATNVSAGPFVAPSLVGEPAASNILLRAAADLTSLLPTNSVPDEANRPHTSLKVELMTGDAFVLMSNGRHAEAVEYFNKALQLDPNYARAWFGLGTTLYAIGKFEQAVEAMDTSIKLAPDDYLPINNLAWIRATSNDSKVRNPREAIRLARQAMLMAPGDYHVWSTLAEAYYASGEYDKALPPAKTAWEMAIRAGITDDVRSEQSRQLSRIAEAARVMDILE